MRSSVASTEWGGWVRSQSEQKAAEPLSEEDQKEVQQAQAFFSELELEYQQLLAERARQGDGQPTQPSPPLPPHPQDERSS